MEDDLERQRELVEEEKRGQEEELRRNKERLKTADLGIGQSEVPPLDVFPTTPLTSGHLTLQELGISYEQDEEVLDLTRLTFDNLKII